MRNGTPPAPADAERLRAVIEALVFASEEPLTIADLRDLFPGVAEESLTGALETLAREYDRREGGLQIQQVAGGYRIATRSDFGEWVRALFRSRNRRRLSAAALETLAIVAYRQPITTPEIQALRGADPGGVLQTLLDRKLLRVVGRKKVVGKPILYGTTRDFLAHFGLNSLEDLPSLDEFGDLAGAFRGDAAAGPPTGPPYEERAERRDAPGVGLDEEGLSDDATGRQDGGDDS
jgi:segregation and condensation protein B